MNQRHSSQRMGELSGRETGSGEAVGSTESEQAPPLAPGKPRFRSISALVESKPTEHPVLNSILLGAAGGIVGAAVGEILSLILSVIIAVVLPEGSETGASIGYIAGFLCPYMFPLGGALVSLIPGTFLGIFRYSRDSLMAPIQPLLAGFLTAILLTLVATGFLYLSSGM